MRTAVVLTMIALAVIFLLGVIASLHEDRVVTTFQADEERYQREREARRAAAERARFLAATPQPLARKRTPFGSGSIEVPGEVTSSSYGTTTSLRWPDGLRVEIRHLRGEGSALSSDHRTFHRRIGAGVRPSTLGSE
jgi:hypothetical protein